MLTVCEMMKKRWRLVYHMTPLDLAKASMNNQVFEGNGDLCDVFNSFMRDRQFAFKDYIIQIEYMVELDSE